MSLYADKLAALRPVHQPPRLTQEIAGRIAADIHSGKLRPGARLPTEQALVEAMGVSRTVVREAVAALRAEGLVMTRQGSGAFVTTDGARRPFRLNGDSLPSVEKVLEVMELRAGVEVESARLAAERASAAARKRIAKALDSIDRAIARGRDAVAEDFAFHRAIADATRNPHFLQFLEYLGHFIIPRQSIRVAVHGSEGQRAYLERIQREHRTILRAIVAGDGSGAREAMRRHLSNSQARYRGLVARGDRSFKP